MPPKIRASPYPKLTLIIGGDIIGRPGEFYLNSASDYSHHSPFCLLEKKDVLVKNYNLTPIGTPEGDLKKILA
jgi:hypothetical protein